MDKQIAGATPAAELSAQTATQTSAPPAETRPRTIADYAKSVSKSLRLSGASEEPKEQGQQNPQVPEPKESPAPGKPTDSVDLSHSNEASTQEGGETEDSPATVETAEAEDDSRTQWPKSAIERTKKLKSQRAELREQVKTLTEKLQELQSRTAAPAATAADSNDQFAGANTPEAIRQIADQAKNVHRYVHNLLEEIADDPENVAAKLKQAGVQMEEYSPEAMRRHLRLIRDNAATAIDRAPERLQHLEQRKQFSERARQVVPDLQDEDSELSQIVSQAKQAYPAIGQRPDSDMQYAIYALGYKAFKELLQKSSQPAPAPKPAPKLLPKAPVAIPSPKTSPAPSEDRDDLSEAGKRMRSSKGIDGVKQYARAALLRAAAGE